VIVLVVAVVFALVATDVATDLVGFSHGPRRPPASSVGLPSGSKSASTAAIVAALRTTIALGTIRVTETCSAPQGISTPPASPNQYGCGQAGTGVVNDQGQPEEDITQQGGPTRYVTIGSKQWMSLADPRVSPTWLLTSGADTSDDPLGLVRFLVSADVKFTVVAVANVDGVPVKVFAGQLGPAGGPMATVAVGDDGLIHQVGEATPAEPDASGPPNLFSTWTFSEFGVTTPITAPPASEVQPGPP
jgi:hypothetical protein